MMAGHTDIPVGTVATSADVATGDGSVSGNDATTGGIRTTRGTCRTTVVARYATRTSDAATAKTATVGMRSACERVTISGAERNRASSRARKSGDGSMAGRLFTNIRLRRTSMS